MEWTGCTCRRFCPSIIPTPFEDRGEGLFVGAAAEMARLAIEQLRTRYEVSQHFVGNVLVELDGDAAHGESYFQAYHRYRPRDGEASLEVIMAGRYLDRFERRAGVWKIAHRKMINDWTRTRPAANIWLERRPGAHRAVRDISDARLSEGEPRSG